MTCRTALILCGIGFISIMLAMAISVIYQMFKFIRFIANRKEGKS